MDFYGLTPQFRAGITCPAMITRQTAINPRKRPESTSQAEYAGSIPVIGSTASGVSCI